MSKRAPGTGGDETADRRIVPAGRIQRQALTMLGKYRLDVAETRTGADRENEVSRLIVEDSGQALGGEDDIELLGRVSQV